MLHVKGAAKELRITAKEVEDFCGRTEIAVSQTETVDAWGA